MIIYYVRDNTAL